MGALFGGTPQPQVPPLPPKLPPPSRRTDAGVTKGKEDQRRRAAANFGARTVATSPQGISTEAATARKTLVGT